MSGDWGLGTGDWVAVLSRVTGSVTFRDVYPLVTRDSSACSISVVAFQGMLMP